MHGLICPAGCGRLAHYPLLGAGSQALEPCSFVRTIRTGDSMRYYVETDGQIFLVSRGGTLDLPSPEEVPFDIETIAALPGGERTLFCVPRIDEHPKTWFSKDEIQGLDHVAPRVLEAVHASMPRVVCEGVCVEGNCLLLVKGNRGLTLDRWTLPGGFVRFAEHPAEGLRREIQEELGVDAEIGECLAVRSKLGETSRLHWIFFFYRIELSGPPTANPDEIAELRFVDRHEAIDMLADMVMAEVIEGLPDFA